MAHDVADGADDGRPDLDDDAYVWADEADEVGLA